MVLRSDVVLRIDQDSNTAPSRLDELSRSLRDDMRQVSGARVSTLDVVAPERTKGVGGSEIGTLVVSLVSSASVAKAFGKVVVAWFERSGAREIEATMPDGKKVALKGLSGRDLSKFTDAVVAGLTADGKAADGETEPR